MLRAQAGDLLPIVVVTGMDDVGSVESAYHAGGTDFIAKPINWWCSVIAHATCCAVIARSSTCAPPRPNNAAVLKAVPDLLRDRPFDRQAVRAALPQGTFWFELSVSRKESADTGKPHFIALSRDITERKEAERRILRLAFFDELTGLPNRQSFLDRVDREILRASQTGGRLAVLFMDLAKNAGRNSCELYSAALSRRAVQRLNPVAPCIKRSRATSCAWFISRSST